MVICVFTWKANFTLGVDNDPSAATVLVAQNFIYTKFNKTHNFNAYMYYLHVYINIIINVSFFTE